MIHEKLKVVEERLSGHDDHLEKHDKRLEQHMQELQRLENVKEDKIVVAEINKRLIQLKQDFEEFKENAVDPEEFKEVQQTVEEHKKTFVIVDNQLNVLEKECKNIHDKFLM